MAEKLTFFLLIFELIFCYIQPFYLSDESESCAEQIPAEQLARENKGLSLLTSLKTRKSKGQNIIF